MILSMTVQWPSIWIVTSVPRPGNRMPALWMMLAGTLPVQGMSLLILEILMVMVALLPAGLVRESVLPIPKYWNLPAGYGPVVMGLITDNREEFHHWPV